MSADSVVPVVAFRTSFGMFVPCDRETYRKLKRIRHLATFAEAERRRWDRSQRRLAHNRAFARRRGGRMLREAVDAARMIFAPFYELAPAHPSLRLRPDARLARETVDHFRHGERFRAQELDCDHLAELEMERGEHVRHAAGAE